MKTMKNIKFLFKTIFIAFSIFMVSCEEETYEFGDIIAPSNIEIAVEIIGADASNPYGDGSGKVNFEATADNEISYQYIHDDKVISAPGGNTSFLFGKVGTNVYTVTVVAVGTGGASSSKSIDVTVRSDFQDAEAEDFLSGGVEGQGKTWYWAADLPLHVGLGTANDDYGNGEFAYESWWNTIQPWDEEKSCMYGNEFVFTKTADGITFEQTVGPAFIPGSYAGYIGVDGDTCHDETVVPTMFGVKNVSISPSVSKAALEGSYNGAPYRQTTFEISDGGFMGWHVGSGTYDIISIDENYMRVRVIEDPATGGGGAWYHLFTATKPVEGGSGFETLVWSDEFDTNGVPDAAKWTYDLGAGGWGNQELQTYTNTTENASVEDGVLKITAKADGNGGYTSARLKSQGLHSFTYGRVDVSAKLPISQGTWPAIWMLGDSFETLGWPACGEIDIMEQTGQDKNTSLGTLHWFDTGSSGTASYGETTPVSNVSTEFHLYSLEWTEETIKIFVDDVQFFEMTNNADLPFDENFFMILNVAMGGTLGGTVDPAFTEDTMEIDYIRVYQ